MPFFETRNGTCLAYEDYGSGPPIVFVAGWVLNAGMWEYQVPCFLEPRVPLRPAGPAGARPLRPAARRL